MFKVSQLRLELQQKDDIIRQKDDEISALKARLRQLECQHINPQHNSSPHSPAFEIGKLSIFTVKLYEIDAQVLEVLCLSLIAIMEGGMNTEDLYSTTSRNVS